MEEVLCCRIDKSMVASTVSYLDANLRLPRYALPLHACKHARFDRQRGYSRICRVMTVLV